MLQEDQILSQMSEEDPGPGLDQNHHPPNIPREESKSQTKVTEYGRGTVIKIMLPYGNWNIESEQTKVLRLPGKLGVTCSEGREKESNP